MTPEEAKQALTGGDMKTSLPIKLEPFKVPIGVRATVMDSAGVSYHQLEIQLRLLEREALQKLCDEFVASVFKSAGMGDP